MREVLEFRVSLALSPRFFSGYWLLVTGYKLQVKKFIEIWSVVFGSLIVVAGFVVDPTGVVHSSVLYVFAICIVNAAALEGIDLLRVLDFFKYRARKEVQDAAESD